MVSWKTSIKTKRQENFRDEIETEQPFSSHGKAQEDKCEMKDKVGERATVNVGGVTRLPAHSSVMEVVLGLVCLNGSAVTKRTGPDLSGKERKVQLRLRLRDDQNG